MKVKIVKKLEFPNEIDKAYLPLWEEYVNLKAVRQLRIKDTGNAIPDCFRVLLNQAKAGVPIRNTVNTYINVRTAVSKISGFIRKYDLTRNYRIQSHKRTIKYDISEFTCSIFDPVFEGFVYLKPQRFDLDFNIKRLEGLLFREIPYPLSKTLPNGKNKRPLHVNQMTDSDYYLAFAEDEVEVFLYRNKTALVLRYVYRPKIVIPLFKKAESSMKTIWRTETSGVI
jgi:hypothetical protein